MIIPSLLFFLACMILTAYALIANRIVSGMAIMSIDGMSLLGVMAPEIKKIATAA